MKTLIQTGLIGLTLISSLMAEKVIFIQTFENNTKDAKYEAVGKSLADCVITDIVSLKIAGVQVVERERIKNLMGELKLQESEYFDKTTTQKMGKGLGANFTLAGSFTVVGGEMRIDARLTDVSTSEIRLSFKAQGHEGKIFEIEASLVENIGKGLELDIGSVAQTKLAGPKDLSTLVSYANADKLMDKGDYKAATEQLAIVRKADPGFKLGEAAYKEAMKKLYASKEKRGVILSDSEAKLLESARQKSKTDNHKVGCAYQWVLAEIYFRQMKQIAGIKPDESGPPTAAINQGWIRKMNGQMRQFRGELAKIPDKDMNQFAEYLNLYVQSYSAVISNVSKLTGMDRMGVAHALTSTDTGLVKSLGWSCPGIFGDCVTLSEDLATFLLCVTDFTTPPYKLDKKFGPLGFELLEKATKEAASSSNPYCVRDAGGIMDHHGDILSEHGRVADAIAKWQEVLDKYPTYEGFGVIENKIKKALE